MTAILSIIVILFVISSVFMFVSVVRWHRTVRFYEIKAHVTANELRKIIEKRKV
ncbi:MAG: hypothetical protein NTW44_08015 [Nitrospirae bacterium]|nr:hypothetical protein [Nitrospirota bacterium]